MARRFWIDPRIDPSETEFVRAALLDGGWTSTETNDWNLAWSDAVHPLRAFEMLDDDRFVNHFPGIAPLFYKDELAAHLAAAGHTFHPTTFSMPHERDDLLAAMAAEPDALWIRKLKRWMVGEGMAIITERTPVPRDEEWLVQRYIANPLLLPDRPFKHVLRIFVVLTSLDPLEAWIHPTGPVKFTSRPFSLERHSLDDPIVHLTNPTIQRTNTDVPDPVRGIDSDAYRAELEAGGMNATALFARIDRMLADALQALHAPVLRLSREWTQRLDRCFELLGFDVLVDADLNPWLLECNISPALGARGTPGTETYEAQRESKRSVVADLFHLVGLVDGPHRFRPLITASSGRRHPRRADRSDR